MKDQEEPGKRRALWFDVEPPQPRRKEVEYWYAQWDHVCVEQGVSLARAFMDKTMTPKEVHDKLLELLETNGLTIVNTNLNSKILDNLMKACGHESFTINYSLVSYKDPPIITEPTRID